MAGGFGREPRIVRRVPIEWRDREDGMIEVYRPDVDTWQGLRPWTKTVLEGIERGDQLPDLVEASRVHWGDRAEVRVRRFVFTLHVAGFVRLTEAEPEEVLGERYQVVQELGRGGTGIAYLCTDREGGQPVVVKQAWPFVASLEQVNQALDHEARVLSDLDHSAITTPHGCFEDGGMVHLVRAYVDGPDLMEVRYKGVPAPQQRPLARALFELIEHVHQRGYLLLDLSPSNFFRTPDQPLVLADVSHAQPMERGRVQLRRRGNKPHFDPPERRRSLEATARSDLFSAGRLLTFAATGDLPDPSWGVDDLHHALNSSPLQNLVTTLCQTEPASRPASAESVLASLGDT